MLLSLILGLIIGAVSVTFALQNLFPVTVTFLVWELTSSVAIIILLSGLVGAIISVLLTIPGALKSTFAISKLKKENKKLTDEIVALKNVPHDTQASVSSASLHAQNGL